MIVLFVISAAVTIFLLAAMLIVVFKGEEAIDARLAEISAPPLPISQAFDDTPKSGLARAAFCGTSILKPIRRLMSGSDAELTYQLALAGLRKPEHVEIFAASKMLLPVILVTVGSFFGTNMIAAILVGAVGGFMLPDIVVGRLTSRRQESIRRTL